MATLSPPLGMPKPEQRDMDLADDASDDTTDDESDIEIMVDEDEIVAGPMARRDIVRFEIRFIMNDRFAIEPFTLSARSLPSMKAFLNIIEGVLPHISTDCNRYDENAANTRIPIVDFPIFLLQETSYKKPALRDTQWLVTEPRRDNNIYQYWYDRNVNRGKQDVLKIEIHLHTQKPSDPFQSIALETVGSGKATMVNKQYEPLSMAMVQNAHGFHTQLHISPTGAATEAGTLDWFPPRVNPRQEESGQKSNKKKQEKKARKLQNGGGGTQPKAEATPEVANDTDAMDIDG